jgi:hypothetical protein
MALLRRCLLELRARQGDYDSHQQLSCVSSIYLPTGTMQVNEAETGCAPSLGPDLSTRQQPAERKREQALFGH